MKNEGENEEKEKERERERERGKKKYLKNISDLLFFLLLYNVQVLLNRKVINFY